MRMLLFSLISLLVGLLLSGCLVFSTFNKGSRLGEYRYTRRGLYEGQPIRRIPIWVDRNFGEADRVAIDDAVRSWNYALNGYIKLDIVDFNFDMEIDKIVRQVDAGGWLFLKIDSHNAAVPEHSDPGYHTIGFTERLGGHHLYLVRDRLENEQIFGVTMHEIGHLLGAGHVGEKLMYPHYNIARFQCIDWETIQKVASYQILSPEGLNYCFDKSDATVVTKKTGDSAIEELNCPIDSH